MCVAKVVGFRYSFKHLFRVAKHKPRPTEGAVLVFIVVMCLRCIIRFKSV